MAALSWLNGAFNLGWLVGPLLAGFTVAYGITLPFMIAAGALALGAGMAAPALERAPVRATGPAAESWWQVVRHRHALTLLRHAPLRALFTLHFAYACGVAAFYEFFPLWLVDVGSYGPRRIALANMGMCAAMTCAALFAGRASAREPRLRASGHAALVALAILAVGVGGLELGLLAIVLFGLPHAYDNATVQGWSAERFAAHGQGAVMGLLDTRIVLVVGGLLAARAALAMRNWSLRGASVRPETP